MSNQHIGNLKISNFKCFKALEVSNMGQVNLIGGKNNVGKTAFLEAVELFVSSDKPYDLILAISKILTRRQEFSQLIELELDFIDDVVEISSLSKICSLKRGVNTTKQYIYNNSDILPTDIIIGSINNNEENFPIALIKRTNSVELKRRITNNLLYISTSKIPEIDIAVSFSTLTELNMEDFLNKSLSLFDNNILELKPITKENGVVLKLKLKNQKSLVLLSSLGEGINRYVAILCAIWASKDGVLLIDEIENGIHYNNYKKLWQIIFQASIDANCQIFATTHSKECIEAFNQMQFENEACKAQYFELYRNMKKDGMITAAARNKEQLQYSLSHNGRIRGE